MDINKKIENDVDFSEILKSNGFHKTIQKSMTKFKYLHPTFVQSKLLELQKSDHIFIKSGYHSGKSTGLLLLMVQNMITRLQNDPPKINTEDSEISTGLFSIILCCSKDIC